jgi:hypothetical protein
LFLYNAAVIKLQGQLSKDNKKTINCAIAYIFTTRTTMSIQIQTWWLFLLAVPIACIGWTVTHEEVFREPRDFCVRQSEQARTLVKRKFFYLFTCEYCFSHYIVICMLAITRFHLLYEDWRGYLIAGFSLVWIANIYMSIFGRIRIDLKKEKLEVKEKEENIENVSNGNK